MLITDEETKKLVLEALADDYSKKILESTTFKAKSVPEIMRLCNIPMTSAYRRIKALTDAHLISIERSVITDEGVKYELYRSNVRDINVRYSIGSVEVDITPNGTAAERMAELFFSMKRGKDDIGRSRREERT